LTGLQGLRQCAAAAIEPLDQSTTIARVGGRFLPEGPGRVKLVAFAS
jgi:hypothetical protein